MQSAAAAWRTGMMPTLALRLFLRVHIGRHLQNIMRAEDTIGRGVSCTCDCAATRVRSSNGACEQCSGHV